jgi:ABC-type transporter Mla subunit MlaD
MVGIGVVGLFASLIGSIVAQQVVGDFHDGVARSLDLTGEVLETVDASFVVADDAVRIISVGVNEAERAVRSLGASMGEGEQALDAATALTGGSVADALDDIDRLLPAIEQAADTIDDTLTTLGALPFTPPYPQDRMLGPRIGELREGLAGLSGELRGQAEQVERTRDRLRDATAGTIATADVLVELDERLDDVAALIDGYSQRTAEASVLIDTQRDLLDRAATRTRLLIVAFGLLFAISQFVPVYLGLGLIRGGAATNVAPDVTGPA